VWIILGGVLGGVRADVDDSAFYLVCGTCFRGNVEVIVGCKDIATLG